MLTQVLRYGYAKSRSALEALIVALLKASRISLTKRGEIRVSAHDVAAYILKQTGEITAMKLQKLVYYSQAWSLVWDEEPLFSERVEAWRMGLSSGSSMMRIKDSSRSVLGLKGIPISSTNYSVQR
jgi:hypothetical protein